MAEVRICYPIGSYEEPAVLTGGGNYSSVKNRYWQIIADDYEMMARLFPNATHQFYTYEMCYERLLVDNTTDIFFTWGSLTDSEPGISMVPVINGADSVDIINLFQKDEIKFKEILAVLQNFKSLSPLVYWWFVALVLMMISIVVIRVLMHHSVSQRKRVSKARQSTPDNQQVTQSKTGSDIVLRLLGIVLRHLQALFYYSDDDFKVICFLYSLLAFFLILAINSVFSTNQLIIEKPEVITNLKDLVRHPSKSPFFATILEAPPPDPCHTEGWMCRAKVKYFQMERNVNKSFDTVESIQLILKEGDVIVSYASETDEVQKRLCLIIMNELLRMAIIDTYHDVSGSEILFGFFVAESFITPSVVAKLHRVSQSGLFSKKKLEAGTIVLEDAKKNTRSRESPNEKMRTCMGFMENVPDAELRPLSHDHIASLGKLMIIVSAVACLVLILEIAIGLPSMR